MVAPESNIANTHNSKKLMSPNVENTKARPDDTTLSIQRGRPPPHASTESSRSSSPSLMDDSPPSDCDYAERVAAQNNMDIVADNAPPSAGPQRYNFTMPPSQMPCAPHEDAPNDPSPADNFNMSPEPSLPMVIPYSANVPADPNLWDSNFTATSLFGTNEFLQSDVHNMACSLQRMACFLKQQSLEGRVLSLSLNNSRITRDECLERTWWSSLLDLATYLYYFTSGCAPIITQSHDLPEYSMITWPCHMIWLLNLPCYLYLGPIIQLDVRDQMFECMGNSFLSGALITARQ